MLMDFIPRQATFDKKLKTLCFWYSPTEQITIHCGDYTTACEIVEHNGTEQTLDIINK